MRHPFFLVVVCLMLQTFQAHSQNQINYQNATPATPEAAAIAKYTDIPMSYSSGTPQIGIPIFSAKSGSLEVPVSLSYNASGIRVEEAATWVGLGWMLSTGPTLTRTVRGLPDESTIGYMNSPSYYKVKHINSLSPMSPERYDFEVNIYPTGQVDLEPDIFSFNAMGYSGKFYWSQDSAKFIFSPLQNIKIEYGPGFSLTLPNGIKCQFGGPENEILNYTSTSSYVDGYSQAPVASSQSSYTSSWVIKEIYDATGKSIEFFYTTESGVREFGRGGEERAFSAEDHTYHSTASFYKQDFTKPILQRISAENCDIYFKRHPVIREDVPNSGKSLDTIIINNKNGVELKSYLFDYGYFISPDSTILWGIEQYAGIARKRLYLKSVQEKNATTLDSLPAYKFTYNDLDLPSRLSSSQDYWGYFNGKNNGNFLLPRIPGRSYVPGTLIFLDSLAHGYETPIGADRRIDSNYTQARMLTKIKYPTGGTTSYSYEANKVPRWQFDSQAHIEQPDLIEKLYTFMPLTYAEPPYPRDYLDTFRITRPLTEVLVTPTLPPPCEPYYNNASCLYTITISDYNTSTVITSFAITVPFYLFLHEGLYKIECHVAGSTDDPIGNFSVRLNWSESPEVENFMVGGLRIKKIVSDDGFGNKLSRSFNYNSEVSSTASSGYLAGFPVHTINTYDTLGNYLRNKYVSNSAIPLTTDGQTVRYSYVTEFYDSSHTSFKTEYQLSHDLIILKFGRNDGVPLTVKDWQNGSLTGKKVYEKIAAGYRIISEESTLYQPNNMVTDLYGLGGTQLFPYYIATEWFVPVSTNKFEYAYPNNQQISLQTASTNFYNNDFLLANTRITNSKAQIIDNKTWYPGDYNNVSGFNISALLEKNIITSPIKQETSVNGKIKSGSIIKYTPDGLPSNIYNYENASLSDTALHDWNIVLESNYNLKTSVFYDINRNLKQILKADNLPSTYIWDYQLNGITGELINFYPVAIVQNADSASVAFTSFETSSTGNWNTNGSVVTDVSAPTGAICYSLSGGNITKPGLISNTSYVVSYWSKNGSYTLTGSNTPKQGRTTNGWTYYEHEITGVTTLTISGSGYIDELRLYPKGSQMISYTYKPSIGILSQCDVNNRISYYDYDKLNRLSIIRDQDKNVLKRICYNYAGLQENCGMGTDAQWQVINSYCEQVIGNTGNLIRIEKNMNPNSSTYGTTRTITVPNAGDCPVCNTSTCSGPDKKCINGVCETGVKHNTSTLRVNKTTWKCFYTYVWSDQSVSPEYEELTTTTTPCPLN